jgi:hypothetical protein
MVTIMCQSVPCQLPDEDTAGSERPLSGGEFGVATALLLADQRPIVTPVAAVQRDEPGTAVIGQNPTRGLNRSRGSLNEYSRSAEAGHDRPLYGHQNTTLSRWNYKLYSLSTRGTSALSLCRDSWGWAAQEALVNREIFTGEATKQYLVQAIARIYQSPHRVYSYCRRQFGRIGICASANCWKRN